MIKQTACPGISRITKYRSAIVKWTPPPPLLRKESGKIQLHMGLYHFHKDEGCPTVSCSLNTRGSMTKSRLKRLIVSNLEIIRKNPPQQMTNNMNTLCVIQEYDGAAHQGHWGTYKHSHEPQLNNSGKKAPKTKFIQDVGVSQKYCHFCPDKSTNVQTEAFKKKKQHCSYITTISPIKPNQKMIIFNQKEQVAQVRGIGSLKLTTHSHNLRWYKQAQTMFIGWST